MSDEPIVLKGKKNVVLEDCENVTVNTSKYVSVGNCREVLVIGCMEAKGHGTVWEDFFGNVVKYGPRDNNLYHPKEGT